MDQIVVIHKESSSILTLEYAVFSIASSAMLTVSGSVGEFKSRTLRIEGPPSKALMDNVVDSLFKLAEPVAKVIVSEEFWDEVEDKFFDKYNAMTF